MPIVTLVAGAAAVVWWAIWARRGSLLVGCAALVVTGYVFGHQFWHARIGPLPITIDRLLLLGLLAALGVQLLTGRVSLARSNKSDWLLVALIATLGASAALSGQPDFSDGVTSKWGRLVATFILPAVIYALARHARIDSRQWTWALVGMTALGIYLAITACFEITGRWSLVFPRYISDPEAGIHFGRARGPELNSVSLGIVLTACFWCAWTLLRRARWRWQQFGLALALPLMALGVMFTYTRSTWLGLAASGLIVAALEIPRRWRLPALTAAALGGMLLVAVSWDRIVGLQREGTAADAHHSVSQRTSFTYVSWQMFRDHPLFGVGFGRFYDRKLPYLSDRSQDFELESLRELQHHNTLLSILTETGLIGFSLFAAVLAIWTIYAWQTAQRAGTPSWVRAQGLLMLALLATYASSALFHDLTFLPAQHALVFLFAGMTVSLRARLAVTAGATAGLSSSASTTAISPTLHPSGGAQRAVAHNEPHDVVKLFGMQISRVTMSDTVRQVADWCAQPGGTACRYIVTPNVDHAVLFQHRADVRAAYADAALVLADGMPLVAASRLFGRPLPERVAGSDLVPQIFQEAKRPLRLFLLGAAPGVAQTAARRIEQQWPAVNVVGSYSPPLGFEQDRTETERILSAVAAAKPDLLLVGLGAPKQELWVHRYHPLLAAKVAICAGATIDFLAGHRRRSPLWMRRLGLEWLHRVCCEPRRLAGRYARDAWVFPQLVWREWRATTRQESRPSAT
jgi:N-acetylglucosaminyldiphosphoundecaprenol N-acetyl-beta-D-mannosaminyltransferase